MHHGLSDWSSSSSFMLMFPCDVMVALGSSTYLPRHSQSCTCYPLSTWLYWCQAFKTHQEEHEYCRNRNVVKRKHVKATFNGCNCGQEVGCIQNCCIGFTMHPRKIITANHYNLLWAVMNFVSFLPEMIVCFQGLWCHCKLLVCISDNNYDRLLKYFTISLICVPSIPWQCSLYTGIVCCVRA